MSARPADGDAPQSPIEDAAFDPTEPGQAGPPPPRWWGNHLGEIRWQAELARLMVDPVFFGRGVPHGDGRAVVTVPGFLAGDGSLALMRTWLRRIGYDARASGIQLNVDCSDIAVNALESRVERIARDTGGKVAMVGHSRGAHFAKALGTRRPDLVSAVVSLGAGLDTPYDISVPTQAAVSAVRAVHVSMGDRVAHKGCFTAECECRFTQDYSGDFPSPRE